MAGSIGKALMTLGGVLLLAGLAVTLLEKSPLRLGRLPGDIVLKGKHGAFYFPVVTCLALSVLFSLVMWLIRRR